MKYLCSLLLAATIVLTACASSNLDIAQHGEEMSAVQLFSQHQTFEHNHAAYEVSTAEVNALRQVTKPITIVSLFGTWCHDSEREVPRLVKLITRANNPKITLKLIAVNIKKQAPAKYHLKYTPTFIVFNDNQQEIGRIVERPKNNIATDIINML